MILALVLIVFICIGIVLYLFLDDLYSVVKRVRVIDGIDLARFFIGGVIIIIAVLILLFLAVIVCVLAA